MRRGGCIRKLLITGILWCFITSMERWKSKTKHSTNVTINLTMQQFYDFIKQGLKCAATHHTRMVNQNSTCTCRYQPTQREGGGGGILLCPFRSIPNGEGILPYISSVQPQRFFFFNFGLNMRKNTGNLKSQGLQNKQYTSQLTGFLKIPSCRQRTDSFTKRAASLIWISSGSWL